MSGSQGSCILWPRHWLRHGTCQPSSFTSLVILPCRCLEAAKAGELQFLQSKAHQFAWYQLKDISFFAASTGQLEMLQWLHQQGIALGCETCREAAAGGHLIVLQWAQEQGFDWDLSTSSAAARGGHLEVLQYALQNGCEWGPWTCEAAAEGGHLAVLQYARQNGCAWDSGTCEAAARGGHLEVLQFAHQHDCEWGPRVCSAAAERGNLNILKWLRQHGCQWNFWTNIRAAANNHLEVLRWAQQQQPPCPFWNCTKMHFIQLHHISPRMLMYLAQHQAPLLPRVHAQACISATEMTVVFLLLKAALPHRTPVDILLAIVSLACSDKFPHPYPF